MTAKQRRFVKEYLTDFNATQAAIRAGYSERGASVQGVRLLSNAKVQAEVERIAKKKDAELDLSSDRILRKIAQIAFSSDEETRDSLRALDLLCKARGMYLRKPEEDQERVRIFLNMGGVDAKEPARQQDNRAGKPPQRSRDQLSVPRGRMAQAESGRRHLGEAVANRDFA